MSVNCIRCGFKNRTGTDLLCDMCRERDKLRALLNDANSILRSTSEIANRKGEDTAWDLFQIRLERVLKSQHEFMYGVGGVPPQTPVAAYDFSKEYAELIRARHEKNLATHEANRLREALAFYAQAAAYTFPAGSVTIDAGRVARSALAGAESDEPPQGR